MREIRSQKDLIKNLLIVNGRVTRNQAIYHLRYKGRHITRLSAIIQKLKNEGLNVKTILTKKDCIYSLED